MLYIGLEFLDALFGLPNARSRVPEEIPLVAQASFANDDSEVAIVRMTLIISSNPPPWPDPTRWPPER